jgi:prepilin-type N-terminal cleavage/methylation domain-containing protein
MRKVLIKQGFTLAELSIVLVVLGIIIAMTLKGFGVLDGARLRSELGKINKFQTAYSLYFERTGHILPADPDNLSNGRLDIEPLYDYGLLKIDREVNKDYTDNVTASVFLSMCDRTVDNGTYLTNVPYDSAGMADGVCIVFDKYYPNFICGAETSYDDMRIFDGTGRYWSLTANTITDEVTRWIDGNAKGRYNCSKATKGYPSAGPFYAWAYMIL